MQVREKNAQNAVEVFGLYWAEYQNKNQRFYLVIPNEGYPGFLSLPEAECELVDAAISGFVLTKNARGGDALLHPLLQETELLDRLIDHDADAMDHFLSQLRTA